MKKVLLIPTYYYLSNPMYIAIRELLKDKDFEFIYFFTKDNILVKENLKNISKKNLEPYFDEYKELEYNPKWVLNAKSKKTTDINKQNNKKSILNKIYELAVLNIFKIKNTLKLIREYKIYAKNIVNEIKNISPDYVVLTSDMSISYRVIKKNFPSLKIIIIQPSFLDIRKKDRGKNFLIKKIVNFISNGIIYPSQQNFGLESKNDTLLLFDENVMEYYTSRRQNILKIINPVFYKLNKDTEKFKTKNERNRIQNKINLNDSKKVIIIFLSDYTLGHGEKVNNYIKDIYIELIKKYAHRFNFIIKNHPRIPLEGFEKNFKTLPNIYFLKNELTYSELLSIGDLNISHNSNASLESLVTGMLTLNLLPFNLRLEDQKQSTMLSAYGAQEVSTLQDISLFIERNLIYNKPSINMNKSQLKLIGKNDDCISQLLKAFD